MTKDAEMEIVRFLALPGNLGRTLEIAEYVSEVRRVAFNEFWSKIKKNLEEKTPWDWYQNQYKMDFWPDIERMNEEYAGIYWSIPGAKSIQKEALIFRLEQFEEKSFFSFYFGIKWNDNNTFKDAFGWEEYGSLSEAMEKEGYELEKEGENWLGYHYLEKFDDGKDAFLKRYSRQPDKTVAAITQNIWKRIKALHEYLDAINDRLWKKQG